MENQEFESIKKRLLKIHALAEKGEKGESENAKLLLEKLCNEYGISMEDILNIEEEKYYTFEIGRSDALLSIFCQIHGMVTGKGGMSYHPISRSKIRLKLTAYQKAEIENMFNWHKENFKKDVKDVMDKIKDAYIKKHNLYRPISEEELSEITITLEDLRRELEAMKLAEALGDRHYHKMIEQ